MIIQRVRDTGKEMYSVTIIDNVPFCVSLEPPWKNNQKNISCIPAGVYKCKRVNSPKYGNVFEITGVDNRDHVLIHWGNWVENTDGCVLLGRNFAVIDDKPGIASSKATFKEFMLRKEYIDEFVLTIIDPPSVSDNCIRIPAADLYDVIKNEEKRRKRLQL